MISIVWFRQDLRLADNPALLAAAAQGIVLPVFIWSPPDTGSDEPGPSGGAASRWWLHHSLVELDSTLRAAGSRLLIRKGPALQVLQDLASESGARSVVWNRLYEPATMARDRTLKSTLRDRGFNVETFPGNLLFEPWEIPQYRVFTAFWKACLRARGPAIPLNPPSMIRPPVLWPESLNIGDLELLPTRDWAAGFPMVWSPGEAGAARRLAGFDASGYTVERDRPDHAGTSRLSPHLHFGEISPRQIWYCQTEQSYRRQLVWREFAHHLLFHFPDTATQPLRAEFTRFPWRHDEAALRAWTRGRTGYPLVDAGMRELWQTGWMHNRVRMVAASFLVKHLLLPWQEGAAWFQDTLVDADLANNTLGWQWVAGCGADAAPYFRIFNPVLQGEKFDPNGDYVRRWVPELASLPNDRIHQPWIDQPVKTSRPIAGYPAPIVEHGFARQRALSALATIRP